MRRSLTKLGAILCYIVLLLYAVGFNISYLWNTKEIILIIFGACFFTLAGYKKVMSMAEIKESIGSNAMIAAYLTVFIGLYTSVATVNHADVDVFQVIALNLRPLLYGFVIYVVLKQEEVIEKIEKPQQPVTDSEEYFRSKGLTPREIEIALLAKKGFSNREIGEQLYISEATVKKHMSNVFEKLLLENREQLKQL